MKYKNKDNTSENTQMPLMFC